MLTTPLNIAAGAAKLVLRTVTGRPGPQAEAAAKAAATRRADAAKRTRSAKQAAATRKANAEARSRSAKRGARTRAQRSARVEAMVEATAPDA